MTRPTLVVFAKAPVAGRVKTRLAATVGPARAAVLFRLMLARTLATARAGERAGLWRAVLAVDPPAALRADAPGFAGRRWPPRIAQGTGDLGARMGRVFAMGRAGCLGGPVVVVGADAPGIAPRALAGAFAALRGADAVFGPAADGGYWLIGLAGRRAAPDLFRGVRWSTPHALADTLASLPPGWRIARAPRLRDIDDADDLAALGAAALRRSAR